MERTVWTDPRLDYEFGALRDEMRALRTDLRTEMRELRTEVREDIGAMRRDLHAALLAQLGFTTAALVALLAHAF